MNSVINQAKIVGMTHAARAALFDILGFHTSVTPQNVLLFLYIGKSIQKELLFATMEISVISS